MKKQFLMAILIVAVCIGFISCNTHNSNLPNDETSNFPYKSDDYSIIEYEGQKYIVFEDVSIYESIENDVANVDFDNIKEWKDTVINGNLSIYQKAIIATAFARDEVGIPICDFDNLYEPNLPSGWTVASVLWGGDGYGFTLRSDTGGSASINCLPKYAYDKRFERNYENLFDSYTITVTDTVVTEDCKTKIFYSTFAGNLMQIRYEISDGERTFIVDETYRLDMVDKSLITSSTVPSHVTLYCEDKGACFVVYLYGLTTKTSEDWLAQFYLKEYFDN